MDYYVLLGVARNASRETIRQAFRTLARRYHPDAATGASAEKFRDIVAAYETLSDAARRRVYDASLQTNAVRLPGVARPTNRAVTPEPLIAHGMRPTILMRDDVPNRMFDDDFFAIVDWFFRHQRRW